MKTHYSYAIPCGLALLAIGFFIRYHIGRRRFNRRGMAGLQQFSNYRTSFMIILIEWLFMVVANLCLITGGFLLAVAGFIHFKF